MNMYKIPVLMKYMVENQYKLDMILQYLNINTSGKQNTSC